MTIRNAHLSDLPSITLLFDKYRIFYEMQSDLTGVAKFLSERLIKKEAIIFVSEDSDKKITGFLLLYPLFSSTRMKRLWLLNDLFVDSEYRGKHISVKLIDRAKEHAEQTESCGLLLETSKSNLIGNNLYASTGFKLDKDHNYYFWNS